MKTKLMLCLGGPIRVEFSAPTELWVKANCDDIAESNNAYWSLLQAAPAESNRGHITASVPVCNICGGEADWWAEMSNPNNPTDTGEVH